jgi:hypothetical protein
MPTKTTALVGKKLRQHLIKNICRIMREYAPEVGVTKGELANDISAIKAWDLNYVEDWFYIYDALGSYGKLDDECQKFYCYARDRWHYDQLARD